MKKKIIVVVSLFLVIVLLSSCTMSSNQEMVTLEEDIDFMFNQYYENKEFNGYVMISKDGEVIFNKGYGMADIEKDIPNTSETKFNIASITKQFTATAIMQLHEKKLLNVEDTIGKYIPDFQYGDKITIHHLLSNSSGLPHQVNFDIKRFDPFLKQEYKNNTDDTEIDLAFTPGTAFQYSNVGYMLLGYIIEEVSGKSINEYFEENIFEPLEMQNTGFKDDISTDEKLAIGYTSSGTVEADKSWYEINFRSIGAAGLYSTVDDLYIWDRALYTEKIISKESLEKIYTPNIENYGYGWFILESESKKIYLHFGTTVGFNSYIHRQVNEDVFIVILSNFDDSSFNNIANNLANLF